MSIRNGSSTSPDGYHYHQYGEAQSKIEQWIRNYPEETDFNYRAIAEECDIQAPSVSSVVLKMCRADPPTLERGNTSGTYRRITGTEPKVPRRERGNRFTAAGRTVPRYAELPAEEDRRAPAWETVGTMKNGALVLRDAEGQLWKAEELEL